MTATPSPIRVRIAPSPTGNLHIGTARTTLFNYLFARHHGGTLILRIEDTDQVRSQAHFTENILTGLKGLGLSWDEGPDVGGNCGPYFQSERNEIYFKALAELEAKQQVYPCFCSEADLQIERQAAEKTGTTYIYSRKCSQLSQTEAQSRIASGATPVWRLRVPSKVVAFDDLIRGRIEIQSDLIGDIIIAKRDRSPIYNFAVVIDDVEMKISHVLRGEDHISNTPKQILIYEALGATLPAFGHFPMILAPDRSKLSKRHGATSVGEYLDKGFLTEALVNYLALLGWSAPDNREVLALSELCEFFDLGHVNKSGAIFDIEKLTWLNGQWLRQLPRETLLERLSPWLEKQGTPAADFDPDWLLAVLDLVQEKCRLLTDILDQAAFLLKPELTPDPEQTQKAFELASAKEVLSAFATAFEQLEPWTVDTLHTLFEQQKSQLPYKMKEIMWPLRAALTGRTAGADLQQSLFLLGQKRSLERLHLALSQLKG
ncbi:MAG: glutamate--tRNA ligase [Candidatus Sericytochromatia bacterium]